MQPAKHSWRGSRLLASITALVLAAPSLWFLITVPPLWRDVDAYVQTTAAVDPSIVLLHGPLYSLLARLPLYFGHLIGADDWRAFSHFLLRPILTDAGVFILLLLQHAALLAVQFYFVRTVTRVGWIRVLLALVLAANPMLYAFAHCVGSEALSAIGYVLIAAVGLRIVSRGADATRRDWLAFAAVLLLLMLTRQINAGLIVLLPLAFLPLLYRRGAATAAVTVSRVPRGLRPFLIAVVAGVACFAISIGCVRLIALAVDMPYRSKIGFTFMWRLKLLQQLSPAERQRVVNAAASHARSPEGRKLIEALEQAYAHPEPPNVSEFLRVQRAALIPVDASESAARVDWILNEMPRAFLMGSPATLVTAAAADFRRAREMSVGRLTDFLFETTAHYFRGEDAMPQLAELVTYRASTAEQLMRIPNRHAYLRWWNAVSFDACFLAWLIALVALVMLARRSAVEVAPVCAYATALVLTGLAMMLATAFLTEFLPRYPLPMFALTFLSLVILIGRIAETLATQPNGSPTSSL